MLMKNIVQIAVIIFLISLGIVIGAAISIFASPDLEQTRFCPTGYEHIEQCHYPEWLIIILFVPVIVSPLLLLWVYSLKWKS